MTDNANREKNLARALWYAGYPMSEAQRLAAKEMRRREAEQAKESENAVSP